MEPLSSWNHIYFSWKHDSKHGQLLALGRLHVDKGLCCGSRTRHIAFRRMKSPRYPYLGRPYNSLELRASVAFLGGWGYAFCRSLKGSRWWLRDCGRHSHNETPQIRCIILRNAGICQLRGQKDIIQNFGDDGKQLMRKNSMFQFISSQFIVSRLPDKTPNSTIEGQLVN